MALLRLPYFRWYTSRLIFLIIVGGFGCSPEPTQPTSTLQTRLEGYFARIGYTDMQVDAGYLMVPAYGCSGCRRLVLANLEDLLQHPRLTLFISRPQAQWPVHERVIVDADGWLDRSGIARGQVMYYSIQQGQVVRIDTIPPTPAAIQRILSF